MPTKPPNLKGRLAILPRFVDVLQVQVLRDPTVIETDDDQPHFTTAFSVFWAEDTSTLS